MNSASERLQILVVDDDRITLKFVKACLSRADETYDIQTVADGGEALDIISVSPPDILITDWMMPNLSGPELCQRVRAIPSEGYIYIILLTAKSNQDDILTGLSVGADDYIVKPFDQQELRARVLSGARVLRVHKALRASNDQLRRALRQVNALKELIPICLDCKKVREDAEYWAEIEDFLDKNPEIQVTRGLCPECMQKRLNQLSG